MKSWATTAQKHLDYELNIHESFECEMKNSCCKQLFVVITNSFCLLPPHKNNKTKLKYFSSVQEFQFMRFSSLTWASSGEQQWVFVHSNFECWYETFHYPTRPIVFPSHIPTHNKHPFSLNCELLSAQITKTFFISASNFFRLILDVFPF